MPMLPHDAYRAVLDDRLRGRRREATLERAAPRGGNPARLRWPTRLRSHCAAGLRRLAARLDGDGATVTARSRAGGRCADYSGV
jgi:hypothetical protein